MVNKMKNNPKKTHTIKLFILYCFLSTISNAQDIFTLYKDFLPEKFRSNKEFSEMVKAKLEAKSKIHPELIYYNIEQFNKISSEQDNNNTAGKRRIKNIFFITEPLQIMTA